MIFAVAETVWLAIIGGVVTVVMGYLTYRAGVLEQKVDHAAKTSDKIHSLVNSNMATQLKVAAVALRRVAILTGDPEDTAAAAAAETACAAHEAKQKQIDDAMDASHNE